MWLTDPSFSHLVKQSWTSSEALPSSSSSLSRFPQCLNFLTCSIINWDKNIFENLFQRKNHLLARLRGIQVALSCKPSTFLYSLEQQLIQKYNDTLHQEYLFWQLKSRIMWLNYSDSNTKFFHLKTLQCWSHSRIVTLKDGTRIWMSGEELKLHIWDAFKMLFISTLSHHRSRASLGQHHS